MNYYNILDFKKEPFSNSPEPEFLFQLPQYSDCLQKLELAVRLRRGINVVIGEIGTGKTTLCRKLIQNLSSDSADSVEIETHLLLDPAFNNAVEFLNTVSLMIGIKDAGDGIKSEWHLKESIKNYLFDKGVDEKKIIVLIIDEGQKIPDDCLEILREFLNYETNKFKLLQIIVFAQTEFKTIIKKKANLFDRVNLFYHLRPLNFTQMRAMINYRLDVARDFEKSLSIFNPGGFLAVYLATGGYPRKVVFLCHQIILKMIIRDKKKAGWRLARSCVNEMATPLFRRLRLVGAALLILVISGISLGAIVLQHLNADAYKPSSVVSINSIRPDINRVERLNGAPDFPATKTVGVSPEINMPEYLGKISMPKKRTIWWTIYNIYGDTDPQIMKKVIEANPQIRNRDVVTVGTEIMLPSIPAERNTINPGDVVVALESGQDIESMYNIYRNNPDEQFLPQMAFLSFWNKNEGFQFAVVIDKGFKDIVSARKAMDKLPAASAARAKILSRWADGTVFFNRRELQH